MTVKVSYLENQNRMSSQQYREEWAYGDDDESKAKELAVIGIAQQRCTFAPRCYSALNGIEAIQELASRHVVVNRRYLCPRIHFPTKMNGWGGRVLASHLPLFIRF